MIDSTSASGADTPVEGKDALWPSEDYQRQVERLRAAIGETIYLVELVDSAIQLAVHLSDTPFVLLGVIDFPRPDPARGLAPHLLLLDDGRGLNLGRVARVTRERAFNPAPDDLLYLDREAHQNLLFRERRLSRDFIAQAHARLGQPLDPAPGARRERPLGGAPEPGDGNDAA